MQFISGKFGIAQYISNTGSLGIFDINSDFKIKFVISGAGPTNTFEVRGRIQGQENYVLIDTVVSNITKTIVVEEYDFLEIVCTVFDATQTQVHISGSGFGGYYGLASVSGTTGQGINIQDLAFSSSDNSVQATVTGNNVNLRALSTATTDATAVAKGSIKLAGDLAGTADLPTVPGLATKEPSITAGTTAQYFRGDKTFQNLDKTVVGLSNVDNTSDNNKPVSTAQAAADSAVQAYSIQRSNHTGTQSASTITGLSTVATTGQHSDLTGVGTTSHDQIDIDLARLANTSGTNTGDQDLSGLVSKTTTVNGHPLNANVTVTKSDIGLSNVPNIDTTIASNIVQDSTHRFTNDTDIARLINTYGTNTGDQTTITGNAGTATALQTARTISGVSFDGTANITLDHSGLTSVGANTHDQIDSHIANTSNPHSVTKTQVGLGNVPNIDATIASNITTDSTHRFVTDSQLTVINNTSGINTGDQDLSGLVPKTTTVNGHALSSNVTVTKSDVGLSNVPNIDATVAANITTDSTHRFVTDAQITSWDTGGSAAESVGNATLNNNQSSSTNVTGLIFDGSVHRSVSLRYSISRATGTNEVSSSGEIDMSYNTLAGTWSFSNDATNSNAGITFDISNLGQVTYTSTNILGTGYVGTIRWSAKTFGV